MKATVTQSGQRIELTQNEITVSDAARQPCAQRGWGASGPEIAEAIAGYICNVPTETLCDACGRYKLPGIWRDMPVVPRIGYDDPRNSLVRGGFVHPGPPFEVVGDISLAEEPVAEDLPPLE